MISSSVWLVSGTGTVWPITDLLSARNGSPRCTGLPLLFRHQNVNWTLLRARFREDAHEYQKHAHEMLQQILVLRVKRPNDHTAVSVLHNESPYTSPWINSFSHDDSSNGNIFRVTGHLCGEFTGHRWIPRTKAMQWHGALMFSLICAWINTWANNGEAGDLSRHRAHYDVIVMLLYEWCLFEGIDTEFEVMAVTPQTPKCHHNLGCASILLLIAMTENEVSISILSWYHKIDFKSVDVVKPNCFSAAQV